MFVVATVLSDVMMYLGGHLNMRGLSCGLLEVIGGLVRRDLRGLEKELLGNSSVEF